jgi:transcriptional regulator with XRE-family HTH domain
MTAGELVDLRDRLGITQTEMAQRLGLGLRAYQDIEGGVSKVRAIHVAAAERAALALAVERRDPMLAPVDVRRQALELARLITGPLG